jgi:hypothetical protein
MSKAEERARDLGYGTDPLNRAEYTANEVRDAFIEGYHQAEKDLELSWEDIRDICKMWIESKTPFGVTGEALSIEVLKRFKEKKEK